MKEIKYKAWDTINKRWLNLASIVISITGGVVGVYDLDNELYGLHQVDLVQFTGWKDKNGVEIYDEDVARLFMVRKGVMSIYWESCEVFFRNGRWNVGYPEGQGQHLWDWIRDPGTYAIEIIGNKSEHPDLLK